MEIRHIGIDQIVQTAACLRFFVSNNYILINTYDVLLKTIFILNFFGNGRKKKILIWKLVVCFSLRWGPTNVWALALTYFILSYAYMSFKWKKKITRSQWSSPLLENMHLQLPFTVLMSTEEGPFERDRESKAGKYLLCWMVRWKELTDGQCNVFKMLPK